MSGMNIFEISILKVGRSRLGIDSILERLERMVKKESVVNKNWTAMMIIGKYW